jgi:uncharacterized protein
MRKNISMYKPSLYNVLIPLKGERTLAYCGLTSALAVWDETERKIYDLVARGGADNGEALTFAGNDRYLSTVLENLEEGRFVVEELVEERKLVDRLVNMARYDERYETVTIAPTLACNFGCDYCYQNDAARLGPMSDETARKTIGFVKKRAEGRQGMFIAWYGGEPLLAADRVFSMSNELAGHCVSHHLSYSAQIVTNGYFLTRETAERLRAAKITQAQVTLDGDKPVHDQRRILKGGGATFDRILENVAEAVCVDGFSIILRVNIDNRNKDGVEGLLHRLREAGLSGRKNFQVYFAPVDICSQECLRVVDDVMRLDEYAGIEARLNRKAIDMGLACASLPPRLFSLCAAVKPNGFVVLPNGDVHKCWNTASYPSMRICGPDEVDSMEDSSLYRSWTSDPLFASDECDKCGVLPNCTGGCAHKARDGLTTSCISLKHNIRGRLVLYAISKEAITWDDLDKGVIYATDDQIREHCTV